MGFVRKPDIIGVLALAGQETWVFEAADGLPHTKFGQASRIVHIYVPELEWEIIVIWGRLSR
jgi:hypothetical protein